MQPYIVCPKCGLTSHNPSDIEQRYCGNCHQFHDEMPLVIVCHNCKAKVFERRLLSPCPECGQALVPAEKERR